MEAIKYNKRLDEEISKFARTNNISYERVESFANWVEWFSTEQYKKDMIETIKKS